jgi:hypothetical protein
MSESADGCGCGCIMEIIGAIALLCIIMGGIQIGGTEYRIASCNCTDGIELEKRVKDSGQ